MISSDRLAIRRIRDHITRMVSGPQLLIPFVTSATILVAAVAATILREESMRTLTGDIAALAGIHPLSGCLSSLGVLLWCAAASISAFAAMTLRHVKPRDTFWFLLVSALLSGYLLFDDLFMFHEDLAQRYFHIPQNVVFVVLGIGATAYVVAFRRVILQTPFGHLALAVGFLGISIAIDAVFERRLLEALGHWEFLIEEGIKWVGLAYWCSYYVHTSHHLLVTGLNVQGRVDEDVLDDGVLKSLQSVSTPVPSGRS